MPEEIEQDLEDKKEDIEQVVVEEAETKHENISKKKQNAEVKKLKEQFAEKEVQYEDMKNKAMRIAAEFDNYKKRTAREMESMFLDAKSDVIKNILPVLDNFERALSSPVCLDCESYKEGVKLIYKQLTDTLASLGVEEIKALGETFDPDFHNAVMHIEDENAKVGEIVEVFMKGYKIENKVLRYSMVKVAN